MRTNTLLCLLGSTLWIAGCPGDGGVADDDAAEDDDGADDDISDDDTGAPPLPWDDDPCGSLDPGAGLYNDTIATWTAQDTAAPPPTGHLLGVGSSSMRRWETGFAAMSEWGFTQRGFGGAMMRDVAWEAEPLLGELAPSAVLLFAGTNDIALGQEPEVVVTAYRCFVERVHEFAGPVPVLFIGITPSPARWATWDLSEQVNAEVSALADQHPALVYIDIPTPFLATGEPPDAALFVGDGLHLSESGYALWTETIAPQVGTHVPVRPVPESTLPAGSLIRVDLGPTNPVDGAPATVDGFGLHWNAWHDIEGDRAILAGEALRGLVSTTGQPTEAALVITGGFRCNGLANGGLVDPSYDLLGTLAVPEATGDFFWFETPDDPGALSLTGLDPSHRYTLRLFASRSSADEVRVTRYDVVGADTAITSLTTTGPGVGADGGDGNDDTVAVLTDLAPDPWGQLHVDVRIEAGQYAYLSLLELESTGP